MTTVTSDEIKKRTVVVADGSGVLVPAMSLKYAYVLTAKHNICLTPETDSKLVPPSDINVKMSDGTPLQVLEVFVANNNQDAALLLVSFIEVDPVAYSTDCISFDKNVKLCGYPKIRRESNALQTRLYSGVISDVSELRFDIETSSFASYEEVVGVSGGGVYVQVNQEWILVGIEYKMEGDESESHNALECIKISVFKNIISSNKYENEELAPILPPFLLGFDKLLNETFTLEGVECETTKRRLREILHLLGDSKILPNCPNPHELMKKFGDKLLVYDNPSFRLADKKLWLSCLELLIISILIDDIDEFDNACVEDLWKRRRLLYSGSTKEWTQFIQLIANSNFDGIDDNGIIVISNNRSGTPAKTKSTISLDKLVTDIGRPDSLEMKIDSASGVRKPRKVFHIDGLHADCIIKREESYVFENNQSNSDTVIRKLKEAYLEVITE